MRAALKLIFLVLTVLIAGSPAGWSGKALAQGADAPVVNYQAEPEQRQLGLFRFLFGGNRQRGDTQIDRRNRPGKSVKKRRKSRSATARRRKPSRSVPKAVVRVEKARMSRAAIRAFQVRTGQEADGYPGATLLNQLQRS